MTIFSYKIENINIERIFYYFYMVRIISLEANIGAGKSTLLKHLKEHYENPNNCKGMKIGFCEEPVDMWTTICDVNDRTIIECYYADSKKYAFAFQMMAYISRLTILKNKLKKDYDIIFTERCLFTDRNVFAKMLYDEKKINEIEYQIYNKWFDEFISDFPPIEYIYLKTTPNVAYERIIKRDRTGEDIPLEYLIKCHDYHEQWLNNCTSKYVIDCNPDFSTNSSMPSILVEWLSEIDILLNRYTIEFDGACRGNPGLCGGGYIIYLNNNSNSINSSHIWSGKQFFSEYDTNNYAEYRALILALERCVALNIYNISIMGDSELVIKQISGKYKVLSLKLVPLYDRVMDLLANMTNVSFQHIPREKNIAADRLANEAIDEYQINSMTAWQNV